MSVQTADDVEYDLIVQKGPKKVRISLLFLFFSSLQLIIYSFYGNSEL